MVQSKYITIIYSEGWPYSGLFQPMGFGTAPAPARPHDNTCLHLWTETPGAAFLGVPFPFASETLLARHYSGGVCKKLRCNDCA